MARLIDADKLKSSLNETVDAAIKWHEDCLGEIMQNRSEAAITAFVECIMRINAQPTIDAVEVVRCKDCKHYLRNKIHVIEGIPLMCNEVCEKWGGGCRTDENGFCYMGERSEE